MLRHKTLDTDVKRVDAARRRIRFVISDGSVDRDNDTIAVDGWRLDAYRKNPVFLWAHDHKTPPVAKAVEVGVRGDRLIAVAEFARHELASTVFELYKDGFMRAVSVGFRAIRWTRNEDRGGVDYLEQELVETSCVPVPSNRNALVAAARSGIDTATVKSWARRILGTGDRGPLAHLGPDDLVTLPDAEDEDEVVLDLADADEPVLYLRDETPGEAIRRQVGERLAYHRGRIDAAAPRRTRRVPWAVT